MEFLEMIHGTQPGAVLGQDDSFGGFTSARRRAASPAYQAKFAEAVKLVSGAYSGNRWAVMRLQEALTTSDFPALFGDILDRQLLANYAECPYSWNMYSRRSTIQDFRVAKRFRVDLGAAVLDEVAEVAEYPEAKRTDDYYTVQVKKHGRRIPFSWETMINDDLNALKDTPAILGRAARRSEEKYVTSLFANNTGFFTVGNANVVSGNPVLSITALQAAMLVFASQKDLDGEPIGISSVTLVVSPSDEVTANNILHATNIWMNDQGGTTDGSGNSLQRLMAQNWMQNKVRLAVNYYLPIVDTVHGTTGWYLFADPNNGRPALEMDFLRGHETPEIFMKAPNSIVVSGGGAGPMDGDFDTDSIAYKIRHCYGGATLDPKMAVYSNGSGS